MAFSAEYGGNTDVYVVPIEGGEPRRLTWHSANDVVQGWTPDGARVLFASNRDGKQNDIYRWTIASKTLTQLTKTDENEYSPLVAPDGGSFITVHGTEQSLFRYDLAGANPRMAFQYGKELIGYHVWIDATHVATFVLGQPNTLQVLDITAGTGVTIDSNIGRSLLKRPGTTAVSYVSKKTQGAWTINQFDVKTRARSIILCTRIEVTSWHSRIRSGRQLRGIASASVVSCASESPGGVVMRE